MANPTLPSTVNYVLLLVYRANAPYIYPRSHDLRRLHALDARKDQLPHVGTLLGLDGRAAAALD